jgi:Transmembrane protein 43
LHCLGKHFTQACFVSARQADRIFIIGVANMFGFKRRQSSEKKLGAIGGLFGFAMFAAAAAFMWWNEARTVNEAKAIAELGSNAKPVAIASIDRDRNLEAIYLQGLLETDSGSFDAQFNIGGTDVILVRRKVQMYQWDKTRRNKRTSWTKKWSSSSESGDSEHDNPPFPLQSEDFAAQDAHVGVYKLGPEEIAELDDLNELVTPNDLPQELGEQGWRLEGNELYSGQGSQSSPEIGDVRVSFTVQRESQVSVAGALQSERIVPYRAKHGTFAFFIERGVVPLKELTVHAQSSNTTMAYVVRGATALFMVLGLGMAFSGLVGFLSWIPILGPMVEKAAFVVGAVLGGLLALMVFLGAWLWAHPIVFVAALALCSAFAIFLGMRKRQVAVFPPPPPSGMPPPPR